MALGVLAAEYIGRVTQSIAVSAHVDSKESLILQGD